MPTPTRVSLRFHPSQTKLPPLPPPRSRAVRNYHAEQACASWERGVFIGGRPGRRIMVQPRSHPSQTRVTLLAPLPGRPCARAGPRRPPPLSTWFPQCSLHSLIAHLHASPSTCPCSPPLLAPPPPGDYKCLGRPATARRQQFPYTAAHGKTTSMALAPPCPFPPAPPRFPCARVRPPTTHQQHAPH